MNTKKRELFAKVSRNLYLMKGYYREKEAPPLWPEGKFISVTREVGGVARRRKIEKEKSRK